MAQQDVKFNVSKRDFELIEQIAERAEKMVPESTRMDYMMDLSATVAQGCKLRLADLLAADNFNFSHDVFGIRRHLDRETGKLGNGFWPRFAT